MVKLNDKNLKFILLPLHSPDLNPLENFFAVLKGKLANHRETLDLSDPITHVIEYDIE